MRASILVMLALLGCAHRQPSSRAPTADPEPALAAWRDAIAKNDPRAAYPLLSSSLRARITADDFALQWKAAQADLSSQEEALHEPHAVRRASGELTDGRAWPLVRDADRWRIAAAHPLEPGGDTPEDTLRRLIAALDEHDFDAVVALLAEPLRTTLEQALAERVARLKTALRRGGIEATGGSSASGSTARLRYDPRYHLDLIQENGRWRIADFN
ncbi:MAG TPA: hypothetical protein VGL86_05685 [Polyangia bacterium]|jgi:hypothetical protein